MASGFIYFLVNPAMPGLVKIGYTTTSLEQRLAELHTTGVPEPFTIAAAFFVHDPELCEKQLHDLFTAKRKNMNREFFHMPLRSAIEAAMPTILQMTPDLQSPVSVAAHHELTFEENELLCMLVHKSDNSTVTAEEVAKEHHVHVQKVLRGCARLLNKGLIQEIRGKFPGEEAYALTHRGREFCFEHGIVIPEIVDDPDS
jgi:hypothetical protein